MNYSKWKHEYLERLIQLIKQHEYSKISNDFVEQALNNNVNKPSREELLLLLEQALNHIQDNNLNNRITDVLVKSRL